MVYELRNVPEKRETSRVRGRIRDRKGFAIVQTETSTQTLTGY